MNDAPRRRRHREQLRNPRDAHQGRGAADRSARRLPRPRLEAKLDEHRSATRCSTSTTPTARRPSAFQHGPVRARQPAYYPVAERDARRPSSSGASARTSTTGSRSTSSASSSRPSTTFEAIARRQVMKSTKTGLAGRARGAGRRLRRDGAPSAAGADAGRDRGGAQGGAREVQGPQGGQERRLHPGAGQGRSEHLRHRAGDRRRQGLHGRRHQVRGLDPVDLEGLHAWPRSSRSRGSKRSRQRWASTPPGSVFNSIVADRAVQKGQEMNPMVNPGAITATSMVKGANRDEIWNKILGYLQRLRRPPAHGEPGGLQVGGRDQPAQPGDRPADVRLRPHQGRTRCRPPTSTPSSARSASTRKDLATMAATLANGGKNPVTGKQVMTPRTCPTSSR